MMVLELKTKIATLLFDRIVIRRFRWFVSMIRRISQFRNVMKNYAKELLSLQTGFYIQKKNTGLNNARVVAMCSKFNNAYSDEWIMKLVAWACPLLEP